MHPAPDAASAPADAPYRLPRSVEPVTYRLEVAPDLERATFRGSVDIDVKVLEQVDEIVLNAAELDITSALVRPPAGDPVEATVVLDPAAERARLSLPAPLATGDATVSLSFSGTVNDQLRGFYRSTFTDAEGRTRTIATTQMEATDARRAFPCWDEPDRKATFEITLVVDDDLLCVSNAPAVEETSCTGEDGNLKRRVRFAPTMKMSTYLVAYVVGPLEATEPVDVGGTPVRVVHAPGQAHLTAFALDVAAHALAFFTDYFGIPYPGQKLDLVAIPDFAHGAMENLGCVTFRETALLADPAAASRVELERIADVVHHEIAHMWFGDLVTMEWWEGIWLNEAFATFMQLRCTNAFRPAWRIWADQIVMRDLALHIDGLASTRPIEYPVLSPNDTQGMFDSLTYEKGGSVLRMAEQYLGETVFRDGIRRYLLDHRYANTVTTDLWDALESVSGQPVRDMMNTWILQGGHPLVTLADGELRQQPFVFGDPAHKGAIGDRWLVPVMTRSLEGGAPSRHLLGDEPVRVDDHPPVVVNAGGSGVFRSRYDAAALAALAPRVGELDELERATLLADAWAALFARQLTWAEFYTTASGLGEQDEPTPWHFVATALDMVRRALDEPARTTLAHQVTALAAPHLARLGWDRQPDEDVLRAQTRALIIGLLGIAGGDESVRAEARRRFTTGEMDGDLAATILRIVADQNHPGDYETFLERYRHAPTPQEEMRYLTALGGFSDERLALDAAERCFHEFRPQDAPIVLMALTRNEQTGPAVWRYLTSRWDEALARFSPSHHSRLAAGVPTFIRDPAFAAEVEAFHVAHPVVGGYPATVPQQLERLRIGLAFATAIRSQF